MSINNISKGSINLGLLSVSSSVICAFLISPLAQAVDLNYESLSSLEQPLALHYQDITFSLTGITDASLEYLRQPSTNTSSTDISFLGNFQINAETQLSNSMTLGAAYFGQYDESEADTNAENYSDNLALYLGGVWGTGSIGNVTGLVREQTRRIRGVGNAELSFDDHLGQLSDVGINYIGRFGPSQLLASIDDDGGFEIASIYQRPLDNKDYRFSLRYRESQFTPNDATISFDSKAVGVVGELTYGSSVFDLGLGAEQLSTDSMSLDRQYLSLGASRKVGLWTFSGEAHIGDIEGQNERSYALGLKYDIARGMSLNLGLNYSDAEVNVNNISILSEKKTEGLVSLRYSF